MQRLVIEYELRAEFIHIVAHRNIGDVVCAVIGLFLRDYADKSLPVGIGNGIVQVKFGYLEIVFYIVLRFEVAVFAAAFVENRYFNKIFADVVRG